MYLKELKKNEYFWLALIILGGFLIRLWLLGNRWINPDEGAHLMDGKLLLDGLIPIVDYSSRQPLYVYIIGLVLKVFGTSYMVGRFIPLVSSLGIILLIFFTSKKMFNDKVALLASAIYAFTPFSIFWSIMVHTQPISVLLNCAGVYSVVSYVKSDQRHRGLLLLGGIFFALSYYVRETSLALLIATFIYLAVIYYNRIKEVIQSYATVLAGYFLICIGAFVYYSQYLSLSRMWRLPINPFYHVIDKIDKILALTGVAHSSEIEASASAVRVGEFRLDDQPWGSTIWQLMSTVYFNSFLYVGLMFSVLVLGYVLFIKKGDEGDGQSRGRGIAHAMSLLYG